MKTIYFGLVDGGTITQREVCIAAKINGVQIDVEDEDAIRQFALSCPGVVKEIDSPSIRYLLAHGHKVMAVKLYHERNQSRGIGIAEAKAYIDSLELQMKRRGKRNVTENEQ